MREWEDWGLDPRREWGHLVRAALGEKARAGHPSPMQVQPRDSQAV